MNAARALRTARRRAGLSQTELARRAGVRSSVVNRIERGHTDPRFATLERLLMSAGATLTIAPRSSAKIDRGRIRALLGRDPRERLATAQIETLDELCRRRVRFVIVGDAALRLRGAPVDVSILEVVAVQGHRNERKLAAALRSPGVKNLVVRSGAQEGAWEDAEELPWLPTPVMRVMGTWIDAPSGFLASMEYLLASVDEEKRELLLAVQEEVDLVTRGYRVYRDPARQTMSLPLPPRRYSPGGLGVRAPSQK